MLSGKARMQAVSSLQIAKKRLYFSCYSVERDKPVSFKSAKASRVWCKAAADRKPGITRERARQRQNLAE